MPENIIMSIRESHTGQNVPTSSDKYTFVQATLRLIIIIFSLFILPVLYQVGLILILPVLVLVICVSYFVLATLGNISRETGRVILKVREAVQSRFIIKLGGSFLAI